MADATVPISAGVPPRLARLDGLRGIAACGVAFTYHAWALIGDDAVGTYAGPGSMLLDWLHRSGWLFVDMFFLLSGFIFAHVYLGRGLLSSPRELADFAVARFARLYPLHLVMLLVTALLFWGKADNTPLAFLAHLTMLQALVQPVAQTFDGPTWSLSVEAACYLLFAVCCWQCRRAASLAPGYRLRADPWRDRACTERRARGDVHA